MEIFFIIAGVILIIAAVALRVFLKINFTFMVAAAIVALLPSLGVYGVATAVAKDSDQTFNEYWNGYESATSTSVTDCFKDGICRNEYQCDPYTVMETEYYTDSEGKSKSRLVPKTKYHDCPYSSQETSYYIDTTLGSFTAGDSLMTGSEWSPGVGIPGGQVTTAPQLWTEAKARIDSGKPGPVTKVNEYKNYILASERTVFKRYEGEIENYLADNLLPAPAVGVTSLYQSNKAYFAGKLPSIDAQSYVTDVSYLNGAVGTELRGDLHVVFVDAKDAGNATNYSNSLMAYWQSDLLGRDAVAKNSIVVVVGVEKHKKATSTASTSATETAAPATDAADSTDAPEASQGDTDATVEETDPIAVGTPVAAWAKAFTGMPLGNERLLTQIESELKGLPLDENFIGRPTLANGSIAHTDGALESILFGANKFERVSMDAKSEDDNGTGFSYLSEEWQPDDALMGLIYLLSGILSALLFALGAFLLYAYFTRTNLPDPIADFIINTTTKKDAK